MSKNWKAICEIPDRHFMWAIALLDLATTFGQMVIERFPEYFTKESETGPVPLSVLRMKARENAAKYGDDAEAGERHISCYGAVPSWMPEFCFREPEDRLGAESGLEVIPQELSEARTIGEIYEWEGKKLVLIDYFEDGGERRFVPAECINIDK